MPSYYESNRAARPQLPSTGVLEVPSPTPGSSVQNIALNLLSFAPVRRRKVNEQSIKALAARIHATGQLKRLMVVPREESQFYVVAGERRLAALQLLARQRQIAETFPVPCCVINAKPASAIQSSSTDQAKAGVDRSDRRRRFLHLRNHCPGLLTGSELVGLQRCI
jgi:hypothetical protein